jgi:cell division septum initiation protein DivIVA
MSGPIIARSPMLQSVGETNKIGREIMSDNKDVTQLLGREISVVKNGLSEDQVVSLVNDLARERDELTERQEHLRSLTMLAERTVCEANTLATEMKEQAKKEADEEVERILSEAHERGERLAQEREAEAIAAANTRSEQIKSEAEQLASEIMTDVEAQAAQARTDAEAEATRIIADAESLGREIIAEKETEALALADQQANEILSKAREEVSGMLDREKKRIQPELDGFVKGFRARFLSELDVLTDRVGTLEPAVENRPPSASSTPVTKRQRDSEGEDDLMQLFSGGSEAATGEPDWQLEVSPPVDVTKLMSVVGYLDGLRQIEHTEINSRGETASIDVYLREQLELVDLLNALPEVFRAEETNTASRPDALTTGTRRLDLSLITE